MWAVRASLAGGGNCTRGWDEAAGSPFMECPASHGTPRSQTWYDDANSTRLKVELADALGLMGFGLFSAEMAGNILATGGQAASHEARAAWAAVSTFRGRPPPHTKDIGHQPADTVEQSTLGQRILGERTLGQRTFNVRDYGAVGDNVTHDTAAVRKAAAALLLGGHGGTLLFPTGGTYLTGAFNLSSHTTLVVERGAAIVGSPLASPIRYLT